jgi:hypothetical protein
MTLPDPTVFFHTRDDGTIVVQARAEGPGEIQGDMTRIVWPGEDFWGVPFAELAAAQAGALVPNDGPGMRILPSRPTPLWFWAP